MGPLHDFYAGLLAKDMRPEMARLTLARKIAAITLTAKRSESLVRGKFTTGCANKPGCTKSGH